jgi:hypothetical protein
VRGEQPQPGVPVQGAAEDQVRQGEGGLGRLAEGVAEVAGGQARAERAAPRVDEDHRAEVGGGFPDWVERPVGEFAAGDVGGDADAFEPEVADGPLQLTDG